MPLVLSLITKPNDFVAEAHDRLSVLLTRAAILNLDSPVAPTSKFCSQRRVICCSAGRYQNG